MKYQRKLGFTEKLARLINEVVPHNIIATAKLNQPISNTDLQKFEKALKSLQQKQALMKCRIINDTFYTCEKSNVHVIKVDNDGQWGNLAEKLLKQQLSENDLLFKVFLTRENDGNDRVMLIAQHSICDGKSIVLALIDLLKLYDSCLSGEDHISSAKKKSFSEAMEAFLPNSKENSFVINEGALKNTETTLLMKHRMTGICPSGFTLKETKKIIDLSKQLNVTVNSLFSASALKVLSSNNTAESDALGFNTMVNMRGHLTNQVEDNQLGFYSSYIHRDIATSNLSFIELSRKIDYDIKSSLDKKLHIAATKHYQTLLSKKPKPEELLEIIKVERPTFGISNIGCVENNYEHKNFSISEVCFCVSSHAYSRNENTFFVCLMTFDGKMTYALHHPLPEFSRERALAFSNEINKLLLRYAGRSFSNKR